MAKANAPRIAGRLLCFQEIRYDLGDQRRVRLDRCKSTGSTGLNPGRLPYCDLTAVKHVWVRGVNHWQLRCRRAQKLLIIQWFHSFSAFDVKL